MSRRSSLAPFARTAIWRVGTTYTPAHGRGVRPPAPERWPRRSTAALTGCTDRPVPQGQHASGVPSPLSLRRVIEHINRLHPGRVIGTPVLSVRRTAHRLFHPHFHGHPDGVRGGWGDAVSSTTQAHTTPDTGLLSTWSSLLRARCSIYRDSSLGVAKGPCPKHAAARAWGGGGGGSPSPHAGLALLHSSWLWCPPGPSSTPPRCRNAPQKCIRAFRRCCVIGEC